MTKTGRPSSFTQETADRICERLGKGESLRSICEDDDMPDQTTVYHWLRKEELASFHQQYVRARENQADAIFDECVDIADDGTNDWMVKRDKDGNFAGWQENGEAMRRSQLRIDTRKWVAGKLRPKVYGDKQTIDLNLELSDEARAWLGLK